MKMALTEVRLLSSIRHPNIIQFKEVFFDEGLEQLCLVTELTNYLNLEKLIDLKTKQNKRQLIDQDSNDGFSTYFDEEVIWRALL
jgi:serine/threonine protein kinase